MLLDGIHMTPKGRQLYAQMLSRIIIRSQGYSIGEGVNPDDADWVATKTNG